MRGKLLEVGIVCLLVPFVFACVESQDDDSESGDNAADDTIVSDDSTEDESDDADDDDTGDAFDDSTDDDTGNGDDSDDATDDDADNAWPEGCDGTQYGWDACGTTFFKLYCSLEFPLIVDDLVYTHAEAVDACRNDAGPVWSDLNACSPNLPVWWIMPNWLGYERFVDCLAALGWPPQHEDIFRPSDWRDEAFDMPLTATHVLNFWWVNELTAAFDGGYNLFGAITDITSPKMRAWYYAQLDMGTFKAFECAIGDTNQFTDQRINFYLEGWQFTWPLMSFDYLEMDYPIVPQ